MLVAEVASGITDYLANVGAGASWFFTQIGTLCETIVSTPVLFIPICVGMVGAVIGLTHRLIHG